MEPSEMTILQLVDLLRSNKAAALKEMTLRFRREAKSASDQSRALDLPVYDGRPGEPLPPEENWECVPVGCGNRGSPLSPGGEQERKISTKASEDED